MNNNEDHPPSRSRLFAVAIVSAGIFCAWLWIAGGPASMISWSSKEATEAQLLAKRNKSRSSGDSLILKPKIDSPFQKPLPGSDEYVAVYDSDPEEDTEKIDVIGSVQIVPGEEGGEAERDIRLDAKPISTVIGKGNGGDGDATSDVPDAAEFLDGDTVAYDRFGIENEVTDKLVGGVSMDVKDALSDLITPEPTPSVTPTPEPETYYEGQVRGYALLYLMHPRARAGVNRQIQILLDSRVKQVYLGVLVDGTFTINYAYLNNILRRIHDNGQDITLGLFLSNGPAMRSKEERERNAEQGSFNRFSPEEFREKIQFDEGVREEFRAIARSARSAFQTNLGLSRRNRNIAYVMLEDNLDFNSYLAMRDIAGSELGDIAGFARNPCPGCADGNDFDPNEDALEFHDPELIHALRATDGYSMDGKSLFFQGEFDPTGLSVGDVKTLMRATMSKNIRYFALWRAERQGIRGERVSPDERDYEIPTAAQARVEIELLRFGLRSNTENTGDGDEENAVPIEARSTGQP